MIFSKNQIRDESYHSLISSEQLSDIIKKQSFSISEQAILNPQFQPLQPKSPKQLSLMSSPYQQRTTSKQINNPSVLNDESDSIISVSSDENLLGLKNIYIGFLLCEMLCEIIINAIIMYNGPITILRCFIWTADAIIQLLLIGFIILRIRQYYLKYCLRVCKNQLRKSSSRQFSIFSYIVSSLLLLKFIALVLLGMLIHYKVISSDDPFLDLSDQSSIQVLQVSQIVFILNQIFRMILLLIVVVLSFYVIFKQKKKKNSSLAKKKKGNRKRSGVSETLPSDIKTIPSQDYKYDIYLDNKDLKKDFDHSFSQLKSIETFPDILTTQKNNSA